MSKPQVTSPMAALAATADETTRREQATVSAWGELMQAARVTAAEQDLDLRYVAVLDQPGMPDVSHVIGQLETEVYTGDVAERLVAIKRAAIQRGRPQHGRVDFLHDGRPCSFEVTATPRRNERGEIVGVLSMAVDLTDSLRAHEQHRTSEGRLAGILDSAMDAIVSTGPDHHVLFFNPAAERMFGVPASEAIGSDVTRFVPPAGNDAHSALIRHFEGLSNGDRRITVNDLRAVRASGEEFPIEASIAHTGAGDYQLFTIIIRDRTERDQLQAQLLQSQKLEGIGRLAGGVAHDFNNLLTVILGYCELLRMRQRGGTELEEINNAARRASQLTRQLLAFSRRQVLHVETLDLNGLIRGLHRMLRRIVGEDVALTTHLAEEHLWVVADVGQMEQVLLNLVVNARDAMPSGGTLRITTRFSDKPAQAERPGRPSVELVIEDSGVGMADEVRSRIFEPFFTTKGDAGTGLGLATVYGIVTQTGGQVECESIPGEGSTFRVSLPLAQAPREPSAGASVARHAMHGHETVLLVEDEALVRELAARALREYGYKVLEAQDADSALRFMDLPNLGIVVSDVVMPGRTGDDLSMEFARRRPGLPVLLMTGYSEALLQRPVDQAHLLRKPFTPSDLIAKIRFLLDRAPTNGA